MPTGHHRAPCGSSSLVPRVSLARCPKALASRTRPCRVFQGGLRFRRFQPSSSRPRRRPAGGPRKLADVNRGRSGRRKPVEARLKTAEAKRSTLATVPSSSLQSQPQKCRTVCTKRSMGPWRSPRLPGTSLLGPEMNPHTPEDSPDSATRGPQGNSGRSHSTP